MIEICRVCSSVSEKLFTAALLNNHVNYFECTGCGYVQTEAPYWLDSVYAEAINDSDTGILWRNSINAYAVVMTLCALGILKERVVDFAGGYGLLVRLLRDLGVDALWRDKYCTNLIARGFEHKAEPACLVTAFEVFEHLIEPVKELESMLNIAPNILLSTEIMPTPAPSSPDWWYYGSEHGQHVGFFRQRTLQAMADRLDCRLLSDGKRYHLFTRSSISALIWRLGLIVRPLAPFIAFILLDSRTLQDHKVMASIPRYK